MKEQTYPMTAQGFEKLTEELSHLESMGQDQAKDRIKQARSFCDFQEDSEYSAAITNLATIKERVSTLKQMIKHAEIIKDKKHDQVEVGSTVSFREVASDLIETYTIVGVEEADPLQGKISFKSPIAKSLLGRKVDDEITLKIPAGDEQVIIVDIS